jgi:hypothetical protein
MQDTMQMRVLWICFAVIISLRANAEDAAKIEFVLRASPALVSGQPVQLTAIFKNTGKAESSINFGYGGTENLSFKISAKSGYSETIAGRIPGGLVSQVQVAVPSESSVEKTILLDEFIELSKPDVYEVEVTCDGHRAKAKFTIVSTDAELKEFAADPPLPTVKETCEKLWSVSLDRKTAREKREDAQVLISHTRHAAAIPFLQKLVAAEHANGISGDDQAARSLIFTGDSGAVEFVIKNVFERMPKDSNYRRMTAYHFRSYGIKKLSPEIQKALQPYHDEINNATKLEISD